MRGAANWCWTMLAMGSAAASASGQVAPPPPAAPPQREPYVRPQVEPDVAPPLNARPGRPTAQQRSSINVRDIDFERIGKTDDNGRLLPLEQPSDFAAIANNPLIDPGSLDRVTSGVNAYWGTLEQQAVTQAANAHEIDNGLLDLVDMQDREGFQMIATVIAPLSPPQPMTRALVAMGAMSPEQAEMNDFIAQDFRTRELAQVRSDAAITGEVAINAIMRLATQHRVETVMAAYRRVLIRVAALGEDALVGVAEPSEAAVLAARAAAEADSDDARLKAARKVLRELPVEQHSAYLQAAVSEPAGDAQGQ